MYTMSKKAKLILLIELDEIIIESMLDNLTVSSIQSNIRLQFKQSLKNRLYMKYLYLLFQ